MTCIFDFPNTFAYIFCTFVLHCNTIRNDSLHLQYFDSYFSSSSSTGKGSSFSTNTDLNRYVRHSEFSTQCSSTIILEIMISFRKFSVLDKENVFFQKRIFRSRHLRTIEIVLLPS